MKRPAIAIALLASLLASADLPAAVPLRWTVETSRATPAQFEAYQGETLALEAALQSYGKPLEAPSNYSLYWQTNGMGNVWWSVPCTPQIRRFDDSHDSTISNVLFATWSPTNDVGAKVYNCFIGQPGTIYHAAFQLRLRPSPGAVPNVIEHPPRVLDLAHTVVINAPWPTDETIDTRIRKVIEDDHIVAPVETNVVTGIVSNTVTRKFVEDLGIPGGGGGGVDTNAVRDIVREEIAPATNGIPEKIAELQSSKLGKADVVPASPEAVSGKAAEAKTARNIEDRKVFERYGVGDDWTWTSDNADLLAALRDNAVSLRWELEMDNGWSVTDRTPGGFEVLGIGVPGTVDDYSVTFVFTPLIGVGDYPATATRSYGFRPKSAQQLASVATGDAQSPGNNDLVKYDEANDRFVKATSADMPHDDTKRDKTDAKCYEDVSEFVAHDVPEGYAPLKSQPEFGSEYQPDGWIWETQDHSEPWYRSADPENATELHFSRNEDGYVGSFTATREKVATSNETFVTSSYVTNAVDVAVSSKQDALPYPTNEIPWDVILNPPDIPVISENDPAFSNAVLAVQVDTNLVATIGELNEFIGDYGGMGATSLGGLLAALLAAAAWLKKNKADKTEIPYALVPALRRTAR